MSRRRLSRSVAVALGSALSLLACGAGSPSPAALDPRNDACGSCRMTVSDPRFAAQLVAPGEEPRFFDDIACLAAYVTEHRAELDRATAYVADHRTKAWVPAAGAVFLRVPGLETPMGSHVVAHADVRSEQADADAAGGARVASTELFGPKGPPAAGLGREVAR